MRRIDSARAVLVFWADLVFHEAALLADDEAKHLASPVTKALDDFNGVLKLDLDSRRGELKAGAHASITDVQLDGGIRKLHGAALFLVGQDRKRVEFKTLFSDTIDQVVRYALKRQVEVAVGLVENLGLKLYADDFKGPHVTALNALIGKGKAVLDEVRAAALARTEARIDIQAWKDNANAVRLANYGELLMIAAKTGRKKEWAEAFFLSAKASSTGADEEIDEEAAPTAPTGG